MSDSPADVVDRQLDAYNDHDAEAFAAAFAEDAVVSGFADDDPLAVGRDEVREVYAGQFEALSPTAEILSRMAVGEYVADHERVEHEGGESMEAIGVYRVADGLIQELWLAHE